MKTLYELYREKIEDEEQIISNGKGKNASDYYIFW
jgi:hypothetical protein